MERISNESGSPSEGRLDRRAGRSDPAASLQERLPTAPAAYLDGALDNPELSGTEVALLLRNRGASPALLSRIGGQPRWVSVYEVKRGLVTHARSPAHLIARLIHQLYWKDLADAADDATLPPSTRRKAGEALCARLEELSVGERITLARRAARQVIQGLLACREAPVLDSLLGNAKLIESDAVRIASATDAPAAFLDGMSRHARWGTRLAVRRALLGNPRTPVPAGLRLLEGLDPRDLRVIVADGNVPRVLRVRAARSLESDKRPSR